MALVTRLDTIYTVNTPEGVYLTLSPAGPMPRMLAWMIDTLIRIVIYMLVFTVMAVLGSTGEGLALILAFMIEWFYPVYFEVFRYGQTPGKKSLHLYVAQSNGCPVTVSASMLRNLLRFVDFLPLFYGFGFISMLLSKRFQRLGDLVAGTVVLYKNDSINDHSSVEEGDSIAPPVSLQIDEQQTLLQFAQRHKNLTPERSEELATLTGPLLMNAKDKSKTHYLLALSNWIAGKR